MKILLQIPMIYTGGAVILSTAWIYAFVRHFVPYFECEICRAGYSHINYTKTVIIARKLIEYC